MIDERAGTPETRSFKVWDDGGGPWRFGWAELGPLLRDGLKATFALGRHAAVFLCEATTAFATCARPGPPSRREQPPADEVEPACADGLPTAVARLTNRGRPLGSCFEYRFFSSGLIHDLPRWVP